MSASCEGEREAPISGFSSLLSELERIERLTLECTGLDLTFSDGRFGHLLWDLRGLKAGVFSARKNGRGYWALALRFNLSIIRSVGPKHFLPTIAHEYAHAVVHALEIRRGRGSGEDFTPHGALWRSLMERFGHPPERCHIYPATPARKKTEYHYQCGACRKDYRLGPVRHGRLKKRPGYLVCGACRGPLLHCPGECRES